MGEKKGEEKQQHMYIAKQKSFIDEIGRVKGLSVNEKL